jgi:hypothetical protein
MPRWLDGFRGALEVLAARDFIILAALFCAGMLAGFVYWGIAGRNPIARAFIDGALACFDNPDPIKRDVIAVKHLDEVGGLPSADP